MAQPDRSPEVYGFRFQFPPQTPHSQIRSDAQGVIDSRFMGIKLRPEDLSVASNGYVQTWGKGIENQQGAYADENMTEDEMQARVLAVNITPAGEFDFVVSDPPSYFRLASDARVIYPHKPSRADEGIQSRAARDTITEIGTTGTAPFYGRVIEEWERLDALQQSGQKLSPGDEEKLRMNGQILISNFGERGIIPVFQAWNHISAVLKRVSSGLEEFPASK